MIKLNILLVQDKTAAKRDCSNKNQDFPKLNPLIQIKLLPPALHNIAIVKSNWSHTLIGVVCNQKSRHITPLTTEIFSSMKQALEISEC